MEFHIIGTIARYEMRTLMRSWFFRIFVGMSLFGLGIFNAAMNIESSGAPWMYRAISASIPYANLIILNLGQAIVAVFLASEFLKQDLRNDTVEVIYVRSMGNGEYILGKTLGILLVFLVLNILILTLGIGFSFISNIASQRIFPYLVYPFLVSLPTLVYILGLSFFIMVIIKNQAVTFILLLGYIALTIFYLNKKAFHIFDFIAYQVPMMYSSISGFGNPAEILIHRCVYLFLGIGLICFTAYKLHRLPQSPRLASLSLYAGIFFMLCSGFCIYRYLQIKGDIRSFRHQTLALNNLYADHDRILIRTCRLNLEHRNREILADAVLVVNNPEDHPADTLIFSLNSGLNVKTITFRGKMTAFTRHLQIIRIVPSEPLLSGDSAVVEMTYSGRINENGCFPDKDPAIYEDNFNLEVFRLRKRFAFLQRDFVCLTRELQWYPVSGTGYANTKPLRIENGFTLFSLHVKTSADLTAVSQGNVISVEKGIFEFKPEYPLTGISLVIGDYTKQSIQVDSVEYSVYTIRGHDYFSPVFAEISDTLPSLIRSLKQEYEINLGLKYPFRRLTLAEVPLHFALDNSVYNYSSEAVQPEMILCPEKGVVFDASDFSRDLNRRKKELKNNNEELLPEEIQSELFKQFIRINFMSRAGQNFNFRHAVNWSTFSLFPQFFSFVTGLHSDEWPVFTTAFEAYISERNNKAASVRLWYENLSLQEKVNLELDSASLSEILQKGIRQKVQREEEIGIRDVAVAKGVHFFNLLRARLGEHEVDSLMTEMVNSHRHKLIAFDELASEFENRFNTKLHEEAVIWYNQKGSPGFEVGEISSYRVRAGEATRYQIRFTLSNPEKADGLLTLNIELNNPNRQDRDNNGEFNIDFSQKIFMPARSSREIAYVFNTEPARMSLVTHISRNLPYNIIMDFPGFSEIRNVMPVDGISVIPPGGKRQSGEIIIDNEDPGFSAHQSDNQAFLKSLLKKGKDNHYKYEAIRAWDPPREWKPVLRSEFYGRFIHSASYTRAGSGERSASWIARLPDKTSYDVYFYLDKLNGMWRRSNKLPVYNLWIHHDQGVEKVILNSADGEDGWNYLGTFSFSQDTAMIELTNQSAGDMIIADAVKWVKGK